MNDMPMEDPIKMKLESKVLVAIEYLRERNKYVGDPGCPFKPTASTDQFSIRERYGNCDAQSR